MSEKSALEKRIEEKAIELFEKDYKDLLDIIERHPVGKLLQVKVDNIRMPLTNLGCNFGMFNYKQEENSRNELTNYDEVKEKLIKEYIAEETDKIIDQLQSLGYLFNR